MKNQTTEKEHTENLGCHFFKKKNLQITGIEEREKSQVYVRDQIFNKAIEENYPTLRKDVTIQI